MTQSRPRLFHFEYSLVISPKENTIYALLNQTVWSKYVRIKLLRTFYAVAKLQSLQAQCPRAQLPNLPVSYSTVNKAQTLHTQEKTATSVGTADMNKAW